MTLNPNVYLDLTEEIIPFVNENLQLVNKFMLLGNEPLNSLRRCMSRAEKAEFIEYYIHENDDRIQYSPVLISIVWVSQ